MYVNIRTSETSQRGRDIYPSANFTIQTPKEVETTNQLNLIFEPRARKSSVIMEIDFNPDDIIEEEACNDTVIQVTKTETAAISLKN